MLNDFIIAGEHGRYVCVTVGVSGSVYVGCPPCFCFALKPSDAKCLIRGVPLARSPVCLARPCPWTNATDCLPAAWICGIISITVISLLSLLGVILVPIINQGCFKFLLTFLVALAVGTMSGDALLHLLPHVRNLSGLLKIPHKGASVESVGE